MQCPFSAFGDKDHQKIKVFQTVDALKKPYSELVKMLGWEVRKKWISEAGGDKTEEANLKYVVYMYENVMMNPSCILNTC